MAKVLVVDDNRLVADFVRLILCSEGGHDVSTADTAARALEIVARESPHIVATDVVVTDLEIGSDCGYKLTGDIRNSYPSIPIVMMSASADPDWQAKAMRAGAYGTLKKPFDTDELLEVVARALLASEKRYD